MSEDAPLTGINKKKSKERKLMRGQTLGSGGIYLQTGQLSSNILAPHAPTHFVLTVLHLYPHHEAVKSGSFLLHQSDSGPIKPDTWVPQYWTELGARTCFVFHLLIFKTIQNSLKTTNNMYSIILSILLVFIFAVLLLIDLLNLSPVQNDFNLYKYSF